MLCVNTVPLITGSQTRTKQFISDESFKPHAFLYLPAKVIPDVSLMVPPGSSTAIIVDVVCVCVRLSEDVQSLRRVFDCLRVLTPLSYGA